MQIRTRPINTRLGMASTDSSALSSLAKGLNRMSSMRAALNSRYCMRTQLSAPRLANDQNNEQANPGFFSYQQGQHRVASNGQKQKSNGNDKHRLPEEVKIIKTKNGKRWSTSAMEVELADDILEVRDGLDKIVDVAIFQPKI